MSNIPKMQRGAIIPNIKIPNIPRPNYSSYIENISVNTEEVTKALDELSVERDKRYNDGVEREKRMIELLESIDKNTSVLLDMVKLLEENTEDQKAILEIINDFNTLATINNKSESQSLYRKIMNKINVTISDVTTINTLCGYGLTIYNALHAMGKI